MIAKILVITDFHKRWKDSANIKGQLAQQLLIQKDIIEFNQSNGITHNIITGDWYDRGFHGLGQAYGSIEMDRRLSASVDGNVYLCIGNHFYLERDENPEMYIIQPNPYIKPQSSIPVPDKPIFNVVPALYLGSVQISFFHYNKVNKDYFVFRDPSITYHIGVYHDHAVVPGWVKDQEGLIGEASTQSYFMQVYNNIDLAICGHIHTKIGTVPMLLGDTGREVPLLIPGSLGITQNKEQYKHTSVDLPVITIEDDSTVKLEYATFRTYVETLRFSETRKNQQQQMTPQTLEVGDLKQLQDMSVTHTNADLLSLPHYLRSRGYADECLKLVDAALTDTLSMGTAYQIIRGGYNG